MKLRRMILLGLCGLGIVGTSVLEAQSTTTNTYTYTGPSVPIARDDANIVSVLGLFVPKNTTITKVTVKVDIGFPWPGDLNVFLYSPQGTRTKLLERNCGSNGNLRLVNFDDSATTKYADACPSAGGGSYRGNEPLANSNGQNSYGTWVLAVENNGTNDAIGWVYGYSVTITSEAPPVKPIFTSEGVVNAASLKAGAVAPLESLFVIGENLGPVKTASAPAGSLPTVLAGVSVSFDGLPAGMKIASNQALAVQAPAGLAPGTKTSMTITVDGVASAPVSLDVAAVSPGLFAQSPLGVGTLKAVNQNGTLNSDKNPAAKGSYVVLYANGLGQVAPQLGTGQSPPASPLSVTTSIPTVVVAGVPASVVYSGTAPPYVGVYQVNIQLPQGIPSGANSVFLYANGQPSQSNVVIYVQ